MRPRILYPHLQFIFDVYQHLFWASAVDLKADGKTREVVLTFDDEAYHAGELRELVEQLIYYKRKNENKEDPDEK